MPTTKSVAEQLCDAVVTELNAQHGFVVDPITSVKQFLPRLDRANLTALQIIVAPLARKSDRAHRGPLKKCDFIVGIGVYQGLVSNENSELGPLILLCEQIGDHFPLFRMHVDTGKQLTCSDTQQGDDETAFFDVEKVDELFQFTALIKLGFGGVL